MNCKTSIITKTLVTVISFCATTRTDGRVVAKVSSWCWLTDNLSMTPRCTRKQVLDPQDTVRTSNRIVAIDPLRYHETLPCFSENKQCITLYYYIVHTCLRSSTFKFKLQLHLYFTSWCRRRRRRLRRSSTSYSLLYFVKWLILHSFLYLIKLSTVFVLALILRAVKNISFIQNFIGYFASLKFIFVSMSVPKFNKSVQRLSEKTNRTVKSYFCIYTFGLIHF